MCRSNNTEVQEKAHEDILRDYELIHLLNLDPHSRYIFDIVLIFVLIHSRFIVLLGRTNTSNHIPLSCFQLPDATTSLGSSTWRISESNSAPKNRREDMLCIYFSNLPQHYRIVSHLPFPSMGSVSKWSDLWMGKWRHRPKEELSEFKCSKI